jgi:DNA invertase Pin-like site-specific DNA recombinase
MNTSKTPVALLVRVSTIRQDTDRQVSELEAYAHSNGYEVVAVLKETISGRANENERQGLQQAVDLARSGSIKKVLVHEISRIARRNSIAHRFVEELEDLGVSVYWKAQNLETLLPSGKRNPAAGIMLALMAEMARNEVEVLRERILSGLEEAKRKGVKLGRKPGTTIPPQDLIKKHSDVVRQLRQGQSVRNTAKITGHAVSTISRIKATWISAGGHPQTMQIAA